ncbi:MAG: hypothetical protein HKN82_11650 [Akkermansiaceae bacterium]|nr:hypothetical protein [Akkermansiaceae bacterium]NNM29051.1 hypothetical protein [Akkermansiaceae bacterium]
MSSSPMTIMQIAWIITNLTVSVLMITASILLLRERHICAVLLLIGSCLSGLSGLASHLVVPLLTRVSSPDQIGQIFAVIGGIGGIGWLLLAIGLLLLALNRRSQRHRIAELEQIIASRGA